MTRQTRSITPPPNAIWDGDELMRAAVTAAALIELAINESRAPVEKLTNALARIAAGTPQATEPMATELATCIESLQFHDRMVQQLTQIRDLLSGVSTKPGAASETPDWPTVRERVRRHFTSESHRMLFDLLMPGEHEGEIVRLHAEEGSVELF